MLRRKDACFTCLAADGGGGDGDAEMTDIRAKTGYLQKLRDFLDPRGLHESENMLLCERCLDQLLVAWKFKQTVLRSQEILARKKRKRAAAVKKDVGDRCEDACYVGDLKVEMLDEAKHLLGFAVTEVNAAGAKRTRRRNSFARREKCGKAKTFVCTYCERSFKQSCHLREHLTSHTGERNHPCPVCGKSFQRISSQRRHLQTHEAPPGRKTKRTPFLCSICGKSFPFSNGVQRHMRTHTGQKNHSCPACDRKFTQSTHLQVHMRTHTGEKPYVCEACGEAFPLNASLRRHCALQHGGDFVEVKSEEDGVRKEVEKGEAEKKGGREINKKVTSDADNE